ncbi:hypothetical protein GGR53DRAFT_461954 [Hypoxylon sp. FL1150]|nr:hypothetical protein GGR53DRAFT_461954 [Hypoxylon sp. FL1150]
MGPTNGSAWAKLYDPKTGRFISGKTSSKAAWAAIFDEKVGIFKSNTQKAEDVEVSGAGPSVQGQPAGALLAGETTGDAPGYSFSEASTEVPAKAASQSTASIPRSINLEDNTQQVDPISKEPESKEPESKEPESKEPESKEPESKEPESKEPQSKEPESKEPMSKPDKPPAEPEELVTKLDKITVEPEKLITEPKQPTAKLKETADKLKKPAVVLEKPAHKVVEPSRKLEKPVTTPEKAGNKPESTNKPKADGNFPIRAASESEKANSRGRYDSNVAMAEWNAPREAAPQPIDERAPRIPCHLRPACEQDMLQVASIYSKEAQTSYKLMDKQPVSTQGFQRTLSSLRQLKLPFVVAIEGLVETKRDHDRVIGFALVDHFPRGIVGALHTHGATNGKITAVVAPEFRRQNIFSALMDVVFKICTPNYFGPSVGGYQTVGLFDWQGDSTYWEEEHQPREFIYLEMEVVVASGASLEAVERGAEYSWIEFFLRRYFQMDPVHHDEMYFKDVRFSPRWLDRVLFRHVCRGDGKLEMRPKPWRVHLLKATRERAAERERRERGY